MAAFMNVRNRKVYVERRIYTDNIYRKLFRFNIENVDWMANHFLGDSDETRGGALSLTQQMQVFLRSLGDPGFEQGVAVDMGIHQSTVSRIIKGVTDLIYLKRNIWINFPKTEDLLTAAMVEWRVGKQIPGVIGAIDCTHIKILKPSVNGDEYVNRKGVCSINVQATCNSEEIFTSVDASWPGSVHDSRIWRNSSVYGIMYNNTAEVALLGDEGYSIALWMLTPFRNPVTAVERNFNVLHTKERVVIERCFGQLKRRFPMINYTIRLKTERVPKYIVSAFVLHNVAKHLQDPDDDFIPVEIERQPYPCQILQANQAQIRNRGVHRRNEVAAAIFPNVIN